MSGMNAQQAFGIVAAVIGVVLLGFSYHAADAPLDRLSNALTGRYSDRTMLFLILGVAALGGGAAMVMIGRRRS